MDIYNSEYWLLRLLTPKGQRWAITMGQNSHFNCYERYVTPQWRAHEDCHKAQFARDGKFKFIVRYCWEWLIGVFRYHNFTDAYLQISYEVEARSAAERITP